MEFLNLVPTQEISNHNSPSDCWIVIEDQVWDVTSFAPEHPGGASCKFWSTADQMGTSLLTKYF